MGHNGKPPAKCGTPSGYIRHLRMKEKTCSKCRTAIAKYNNLKRNPNKEEVNARARETYRKRMQNDSYRERKRNQSCRSESKRSAKKRNNNTETYTLLEVLETYGNICHICSVQIDLTLPRQVGTPGWQLGLHLDHVIPISKGGPDTLANVKPSHALCNLSKNDRIIDA